MSGGNRIIDLGHRVSHRMPTYPWTPRPVVAEYLTREQSTEFLSEGVSFGLAQVLLAGQSGTAMIAPFKFDEKAADIASVPLEDLVDVPAAVIPAAGRRRIGPEAFDGRDLEGRAVLIRTGHDRHWGTAAYFADAPNLTARAAERLLGARLVAIDAPSVDDEDDISTTVQEVLLGAGVPVVVSVTRLSELPLEGALLTLLPAPMAGVGTFPVRPVAVVSAPGGTRGPRTP
ncbi:cyclase family protein [Bailinhaonella thermotolerans]|uniref:Cyclase family protein n=1 Tax=Bailinhaonella thermotolerans TaxID=1070861 RepID=A0A3A4BBG5_9ACTN|nr:cyclase family protein [Bailinhaonella thermotolerans]RJL35883.1 cyclase family protein [Bailinhaonella thermotolerans]